MDGGETNGLGLGDINGAADIDGIVGLGNVDGGQGI